MVTSSGPRHRVRTLLAMAALAGVAACGDGDAPLDPGTGPGPVDPDRLLTDEELRTREDPQAPAADLDRVQWLDAHHHPIRSLRSDDFSDLRFLEPLLRDKRVVQLGESGHGVREYNELKGRLIRYLHEELGYSVVAFESSVYECDRANEEPNGVAMLFGCLFRVWHTEELESLFYWMEDARTEGSPPLILAGFDNQVSSTEALRGRPAWLRELVAAAAGEPYADAVFELDSTFVAHYVDGTFPNWMAVHVDSLEGAYGRLADTLEVHRGVLEAAFPDARERAVIAARTARSMVAFVRQLSLPGGSRERVITRDSTMARNLEALLDLHGDRKVIVWGHNFHLRHANTAIPEYGMPTMGTWLHERHPDEVYTIGFYMYRGLAALNNREVYVLERPGAGSLENLAYHVRRKHFFLDVEGVERGSGNEWLFEPMETHTWGISDVTLVVRDQYDGIVYVDEVQPPDYLP